MVELSIAVIIVPLKSLLNLSAEVLRNSSEVALRLLLGRHHHLRLSLHHHGLTLHLHARLHHHLRLPLHHGLAHLLHWLSRHGLIHLLLLWHVLGFSLVILHFILFFYKLFNLLEITL